MGTVLESMASGKAVITTKGNGNEDVIQSGENGILVEPRDASGLAVAIVDLLKDDEYRVMLGKNAEDYILKNVTWEKNTEKLSSILEEISGKVK